MAKKRSIQIGSSEGAAVIATAHEERQYLPEQDTGETFPVLGSIELTPQTSARVFSPAAARHD